MVSVRVKTRWDGRRVQRKARDATITSLGRAGAYLRGIARRSIKVAADASRPGKPPHTRRGRLKNAILYAVEKPRQGVVIGSTASEIGRVGSTHEFGGTEPPKKRRGKRRKYPARPFMGPALQIAKERLPKFWANSVRGG